MANSQQIKNRKVKGKKLVKDKSGKEEKKN